MQVEFRTIFVWWTWGITGLIGDSAASPGYGRKAQTGLPGFDALVGAIPAERMTVVCGGAGSGKTVFALPSLFNGWRLYSEPGVFVSFEEDTQELLEQAAGFGWTGTAEDDRVRVIGARPDVDGVLAGDFDLRALLAGLGSLIETMKAKQVIFDALDALLVLMETAPPSGREFYRAYNWAKDLHLMAIFAAKVDPGEQVPQQAFPEYLANSVIFLNHCLSEGIPVRGLRIVKCRKAGSLLLGISVIERLLDYAKAKGTTLMLTTLLERGVEGEATRIQISSLADTWISVPFKPLGGKRNRALTVIKSRGTAHSNQVRELILSSEGITLADVYCAGGKVLMGTARFEREQENVVLELERQNDHARRLEENASQQTQFQAEIVESQWRLAFATTQAERLQKIDRLCIASRQEAHTAFLGVRGAGSSEGNSAATLYADTRPD